jgi:cytochrome c oxidase subunit 2
MDREFQLFPEQASDYAFKIDTLYGFLWLVSAFFTVLIFCLIVYFAIKYRRRHKDEVGKSVHGGLLLEITWSVIPLGITMIMFFWGSWLFFDAYRPPKDALDIRVIGKQWMWKLQHANGRREINELHVPVGQPIRLTLASQDVIHSFYVPAFRVKMDAVPGRYTTAYFTPTKTGEFHLFCAEYCGTQHSGMIGKIVVMEQQDYQEWLAGSPVEESPESAGARLFQSLGCMTCHGVQAPSMAGLFGSERQYVERLGGPVKTATADEAYLRESILDSGAKIAAGYQPIMPSYRNQVTEEQLFQLIAYIKSLGRPAPRPHAHRTGNEVGFFD